MKNEVEKYRYIGQKIKEARDAASMPQKELADKIGFESATAISLIESGERKVSINDLAKIADILHRDIKFFLGQEEKADIRFALRADEDLSKKDQEEILRFIDFTKNRKDGTTK